jgi:osmotically-inducible protein OsmY
MSDRYEQDRERYSRDRGQEYDQGREDWRGRGNQSGNQGNRGYQNDQGYNQGNQANDQGGYQGRGQGFNRDFNRDYNQESGRENYFSAGGPNQGGRYEDQNDWSSRRGAWTGMEGNRQGQDSGRYAAGGSYYGGTSEFGGGMSQYGEQGRHSGRGPKGYRRSDERIKEDVSEHLTQNSWVDASEIEIDVKDGEVTLSGTVQSRDEKRRAEDVAERVSGVHDVHNQIRVQSQHQHQGAMAGQSGNTENARSGTQQAGSQQSTAQQKAATTSAKSA